jgi:hypothetical protein
MRSGDAMRAGGTMTSMQGGSRRKSHRRGGFRQALLAGVLGVSLGLSGVHSGRDTVSANQTVVRRAASPEIVQEIRAAVDRAKLRFEARDAPGVLAHVSEQYRTGPFTKAGVQQQLLAIYEIYPAVRARVVVDAVEMVGDTAWVYTTGEVTGRLPVLGNWMTVWSWERELEVARREGAVWRLWGYQQ